jgi:hypothetical protein
MIDDFHKSVMRGLKKPLTTISQKEMSNTKTDTTTRTLYLGRVSHVFELYEESYSTGWGDVKLIFATGSYEECLQVAKNFENIKLVDHVKEKMERINFNPNKKPNVDYAKKLVQVVVDLNNINNRELSKLLETYNDGFFSANTIEKVVFNYSRYETEFEYEKRIAQEKIDFGKWEEDYKKWQNINDPDKKFKDPEYIEYLRLRKKIKEKGYPLEPKSKEKY